MTEQALEPALTDADRRVLAVVSACGEGGEYRKREPSETVTVWQMGEALDLLELDGLMLTVRGLEHLGYVRGARSRSRKRVVWWRTAKGDEALA